MCESSDVDPQQAEHPNHKGDLPISAQTNDRDKNEKAAKPYK